MLQILLAGSKKAITKKCEAYWEKWIVYLNTNWDVLYAFIFIHLYFSPFLFFSFCFTWGRALLLVVYDDFAGCPLVCLVFFLSKKLNVKVKKVKCISYVSKCMKTNQGCIRIYSTVVHLCLETVVFLCLCSRPLTPPKLLDRSLSYTSPAGPTSAFPSLRSGCSSSSRKSRWSIQRLLGPLWSTAGKSSCNVL